MSNTSSKTLLTEGPIWKRMTAFAFPLFLGNLFQQLYNTADSLIVGNFLGSNALAAVSSSGSLIFLLVGFFNGISIGAGVVIARYYGARQKNELQKAIHTTIGFGLISGILLTILGLILAPRILLLMKTPADVLPNSIRYFRIYFLGSVAFVLYNNFVGIMQSVGDSKHPLYYLIFSSMVNVGLDLLFVGVFHMGVGSAATATIISQFVSAFLCFYRLTRKSPEEYRVYIRKIQLNPYMLRQIISNGLPAGVQNSIISLANVVVQSNINSFGKMAVAGWRFLFQGRRFWLSSYHLLLHVPDYLYQPESGSKKIRPGKKRRAVRYYLQPDYGRTYWNHHLHRSSGTDRRLQQRSGGSGIWRPTGKNGHSVLFSVSLFPLHCRSFAGSRKIHHPHVCYDGLLVYNPSHLHHCSCPDYSIYRVNFLGVPYHLDPEFHCFPALLPEIRLAAWISPKEGKVTVRK